MLDKSLPRAARQIPQHTYSIDHNAVHEAGDHPDSPQEGGISADTVDGQNSKSNRGKKHVAAPIHSKSGTPPSQAAVTRPRIDPGNRPAWVSSTFGSYITCLLLHQLLCRQLFLLLAWIMLRIHVAMLTHHTT
jgi:hypothetical protein